MPVWQCISSFENVLLWKVITYTQLPVHFPANICWSSRRLQDMSWRCLQNIFSVTIFCLEGILRRCLEDFLKTSCKPSWRSLGRPKIVMLKTSSRCLEDMSWKRLEDMSWRRLGDKQNVYWGYLYLTNLYLTNLYLTNLRWIQKTLISTQ